MWKKCNVFRHFSGPVYPQYMILGSMDIYERIPFAWYTRIYVNLNFRRLPYLTYLTLVGLIQMRNMVCFFLPQARWSHGSFNVQN